MAQLIFVVLAVVGSVYFAVRRHPFDFSSLAYFSAVVYFLPGFFGYSAYHLQGGEWIETDLSAKTYTVFCLVLASIALFSLIAPLRGKQIAPLAVTPSDNLMLRIMLVLAIAGLVATVVTSGRQLMDAEKSRVMESLGRGHILFYSSAMTGLILAFIMRKWGIFLVFLALLLIDLYIGFRMGLSIAVVAVLAAALRARGHVRLIQVGTAPIFIAGAFALTMLAAAQLAHAVKSGDFESAATMLVEDDFLVKAVTRSEPFVIQNNLNEVLLRDFQTGFDHVLGALANLIPFSPELGIPAPLFAEYMQSALFPDLDYGLASNIWAQMWSAGGWPLLLAFIVVFNLVLRIGSLAFELRSAALRATMILIMTSWAFYLHRNDLTYAMSLAKRPLAVLLTAFVLAKLLLLVFHQPSHRSVGRAEQAREPRREARKQLVADVDGSVAP